MQARRFYGSLPAFVLWPWESRKSFSLSEKVNEPFVVPRGAYAVDWYQWLCWRFRERGPTGARRLPGLLAPLVALELLLLPLVLRAAAV